MNDKSFSKMKNLKSIIALLVLTVFSVNAWGVEAVGTFTKVTDASTLAANDEIIIVADAVGYALSTTQNSNNRGRAAVTKSDNEITLSSGSNVQLLTLSVKNSHFEFNTGDGYLYAASSSNNYLKTQTTNNANGEWAIFIDDKGVATITAQGSNSRNVMQYNSTSSLFSCYGSASQGALTIYKKAPSTFSVTYNANGATSGTVPTDATAYTSGATVTVKGNTGNLVKTNKKFGGWNTNQSGTGTNYAENSTFSITANTTLYAKWNDITYTDYITECSSDPSISVSTAELSGFTYIYSQGPSAAKMVTVYGSYLDNNVTVTASDNYEICLSQDGSYTSTINLTPTDQMVNAPIYVRLKAGKDVNSYNGTLTVASTGLDSKTVSLSGSVTRAQLATPSVTATPGVHQITLSWAAVPNADSYQLIWNGGTPETVTSPVTKTDLTGGQSYSYSLVAIGSGNYSNSAAAVGNATAGKETYTVTFQNNGSTDGAPAAIQVEEGGTLGSNLPDGGTMTAPITGYSFVGWVNHNDIWSGFEPTLTQTLITGNEPINADVTYDAVWAKGGNDYKIVRSASELTSGNYVIDGYDDDTEVEEAMDNTFEGKAFPTEDHGVISTTDNSIIWNVTIENNKYALRNLSTNTYFNFTGSSSLTLSSALTYLTISGEVVDDLYEVDLNNGSRHLEYDNGKFDSWSSAYNTIYFYKQDISNYFVTTPNEYTVTWHKGNAGTETTSAFEGQTFADIVADAPSVADDAAGDCANKFMGWATESIASNEGVEENAVAWAKDNTTPISGNIDYYAVFAYKEGSATSYTLTIGTSNVPTSYDATSKTLTAIDDADASNTMDVALQFKGVMLQSSNIQVRKSDKGGGYIYNTTNLGSVTSISAGDLNTYYGNAEHPTSGSTAGTPYFTIDNTSNTETLSEIVIKYTIGSASYSNYVTQCTPPVYTAITLDKGTNGQTDGSATAQQSKTTLTAFTHAVGPDHYHLLGYYANDTKVIDAAGALVANVANYTDADGKWLKDDELLTLTAQWEVNSHTLTWAGLEGANITIAGSPASGSVAWNTALTAPVATKDGYQLIGWSPEVPANMPDDDATYTALWAPVIVIDPTTPTPVTCYQDEDASLTIMATVGEGTLSYQWQSSANGTDGWADIANATEATYKPSTTSIGVTHYRCVVTSNLALTATSSVATVTVNKKLSNKYTITYAYKGWGTEAGSQVFEVDGNSEVTLPTLESLDMTQEGYTFVKWQMPDGTFKQPNETFTMPTENIVISAVLEEIQQNITYTVNSSAASQLNWTSQPATVDYWDEDLTAEYTITPGYHVSAAVVTVNDVALTAGEIEVNDESIVITPSAKKFDGAVSITLTVEPMQYTVSLSADGATNDYTKSVEATFGQDMPTPITLPIKPGYTFLGYYDAQTGGTQYYTSAGASVRTWDVPAGATLHAQWSTVSYGITYTETTNLTWGEKPADINIETAKLTAYYTVTNGYEVTGMTVTVGGNAVAANDIDYNQTKVDIMTTFSGAVVITPTVTPIHYTITYLKNDGSATSSTQEAVYMENVTLKNGTAFNRKGYTIDHWATEDESTTYVKGYTFEHYNLTSDLTLKAIWAVKESDWYTITFVDQLQDSEVAPISGILTVDGFTFPILEDKDFSTAPPEDTGQCYVQHYHFMGWIAEDDKDNEITESNIIKGGTVVSATGVTANATYYAIWATATMQ